MGGIDLLDSLTSLCKQKINSMRCLAYTHDCSCVQLDYRRHCKLLNEGKTMSLYSFICNIASGLIEVKAKVGRPLASGLIEVKAKVGRPLGKTPPQCKRAVNDVRTDGDSHLPSWVEKRQRCKMNNCDRLSYISCLKCGVNLCLNKDRNCFLDFH